MKIAGFHRELWPSAFGTPEGSVDECRNAAPLPDEQEIIDYLRSGHEIVTIMGATGDVLGSEERILGGDSVFTDGEWVWRGDLSFYLRAYHVNLFADFVARVRGFGYVMPSTDRERLVSLAQEVMALL